MNQELKDTAKKLLKLIRTLEQYENYKHKLDNAIHKVEEGYQRGQFSFFQYKELISELLKGRTRDQWRRYYDSYIIKILRQYNYYISLFYIYVKQDQAEKRLHLDLKQMAREDKPLILEKLAPTKEMLEKQRKELKPISSILKGEEQQDIIGLTPEERLMAKSMLEEEKKLKEGKSTEISGREIPQEPRDKGNLDKVIQEGEGISIGDEVRSVKNPFSFKFLKHILTRMGEKETFDAKKTEVPKELIDLNRIKSVVSEINRDKIVMSNLQKEAKKFKKIISHKEKTVTKNISSFGAIANLLLKKWSLYLIEIFPEFFKGFYDSLKIGNVRILSSTYTNIMLLSMLLVGFFTFVIFSMIFFAAGLEPINVLGRTLFTSILCTVTTFFIYFSYPYMRINSRKRNVRTNIPFAVNHMAAVASSGVAPDTMFRLISNSEEYGAICLELTKIVEFIDIFGYDLLSAVRSVSKITPAPELKEFFEGFISTIETGGDLKEFLREKSDEFMLTYKLERQKYNETVSLYSDIYTGVLIAAPLFFVVALSLVNVLGGSVGNVDVNVIISLGTYVGIPALNIAFILFLQMTQPDV